ncbi:hypothetical protein CAPTEDRAFT_225599 [Capitella teleta]|uniref:PSP proline-rich domain-containing protein n=1 Tax=Capitella teleta TaxID=283909 RepID=R7UD92_CAPTE|nr:hypothetical protein CAPTEDRAFT_225599 [Capitella teleta]|eukprot:ELU04071.1 hypothetical protein CAPTEDRAFT_225599 [Capitella teleta]
MAAFGDPTLFEEFTKERDSSDKILLSDKSKQIEQNSTKNLDDTGNPEDLLGNSENGVKIPRLADDTTENESAEVCLDSATNIGKPINLGAEQNAALRALKEDYERANIQNILCDIGPAKIAARPKSYDDYAFSAALPNFVQVGQLNPLAGPSERAKFLHTNSIIGSSQIYSDCVVDALGWPLTDYNITASLGWEIPRYEQVFRKPLPVDPEEEEKEQRLAQHPKSTCFNCGGDHVLAACTEPKNMARISKARQEFMANSPSNKSQARYSEEDPRFAKFKAGVVSDSLRKALGLHSDQLPPYIYRMRRLGYPPGHLEEAFKQDSGLTVFDNSGKEVPFDTDSDKEDGEVNESKQSSEAQYDIKKIVEYPGFNVDIPKGFTDESATFRAPKMQHFQMKHYFESQIAKQKKPLKRKQSHDDDITDSRGPKAMKTWISQLTMLHAPPTSSSLMPGFRKMTPKHQKSLMRSRLSL